jgi:hypothetical protein
MIIRWRKDVKMQVKFKIKGEQDIEDVEDKIKGTILSSLSGGFSLNCDINMEAVHK